MTHDEFIAKWMPTLAAGDQLSGTQWTELLRDVDSLPSWATLPAKEMQRVIDLLTNLSALKHCCELCGKPVAYPGARFCGAGCSARWEAGDRS